MPQRPPSYKLPNADQLTLARLPLCRFFTYDGTVFWDRERRSFDHALLRRLASGDAAPSYQNVTPGAESLAETLPRDFRIATLSLAGGGHGCREEPALRTSADAAAMLRDLDADVIMLQECTEDTRVFLEEQDWVRDRYEVSGRFDRLPFISLRLLAFLFEKMGREFSFRLVISGSSLVPLPISLRGKLVTQLKVLVRV